MQKVTRNYTELLDFFFFKIQKIVLWSEAWFFLKNLGTKRLSEHVREAFTIASEEEEDRMAYFWGRTFCVGNSKKKFIALTPPHRTPPHHTTPLPPIFIFVSAGWNIVAREIPSERASGNKQNCGCVGTKQSSFFHHCNAGCCCSTFMCTHTVGIRSDRSIGLGEGGGLELIN